MRQLYHWIALALLAWATGCNGQAGTQKGKNQPVPAVGGGCDGCELMHVGMPQTLRSVDTTAGWRGPGQKLLVTGTVYHLDGKTPAANVILYYWQTDHHGRYSTTAQVPAQAKAHGHLRGWVKTDATGTYSIYTGRPAPYPARDTPAHIHLAVKEPSIRNEYYLDDLVFDDDPLLRGKRKNLQNRGGSGILRPLLAGDVQVAEHNVVLGLNIPNYPTTRPQSLRSGLEIGEENPSFMPYHAYGPDRGTRTCPVCKYGRYHGIMYFVGNRPDWEHIKRWLAFLEEESEKRRRYLKVYFVYGNERDFNQTQRQQALERLGRELQLQNTALTYVASFADTASEAYLNKINPDAENTFVVYKHRTIVDKWVNLKPTPDNFARVRATLDRTTNDYFHLSEAARE
ncbi:dioxygenase family protein [Hymenobacter latericus]|uniref:dioxygenase family protein n=1 Tax=Hymenobacter sp. YIM 151858-1 TaxID=2987688 RepID=UPI00222803BB|nr:intradiol ring-cleavage dioxygenase [Hymenobacter sp. YIM 151858-1]UYZ61142.1 intradiol ring-cleavage dioxygenase [Hymenobacter sp. YIM 151858-1]